MLYATAPKGDELIIKLDNNGIWFHADAQTPYTETNLPFNNFGFKNSREIYWRVKLLHYDETNKHQYISVEEYEEKDHYNTWLQPKPEKPIEKYIFNKLDWSKWEKQLSMYIKNQHLRDIVFNMDTLSDFLQPNKNNSYKPPTPKYQAAQTPKPPSPTIINKTFEVLFEDATFKDGFVTAAVIYSYQYLNITIENTFIKSQFNYIKLWFKKKFNSPTFKVIVNGSILYGNFTLESALSEEISKINEAFIEECRIYQVEAFLKKTKEEPKLLTRIAAIFTKPETEPIFNQETLNELEVINQMLDIKNVRNEYQLAFLSGHNKVAAGKIMVSKEPSFGFVFCFQEDSKTTFVWELLESNATYLWIFNSTNRAFDTMVDALQLEMSKIKEFGREAYLHREDNHEPFKFHRIFHTKPNETIEGKNQGLELWIARFNKLVF